MGGSGSSEEETEMIREDITNILVTFYPRTIDKDSQNKVSVTSSVGNGMEIFGIRVSFFEPSNFGALSPVSFLIMEDGR